MTEYAHNHPPRCCCIQLHDSQRLSTDLCPLCPEHGELAQLSNSESRCICRPHLIPGTTDQDCPVHRTEYPCCHQLAGRPHTDYCPRLQACTLNGCPYTRPHYHQGDDEIVFTGGHTLNEETGIMRPPTSTTQATAQTSQPATHTRTTPLDTPTPAGACPSCHLDYDWPPTQACTQPDTHDHPR
jgi:hypothetical protein